MPNRYSLLHSMLVSDHSGTCLIQKVDELKRWLIQLWCTLDQYIVDMAIDQWRTGVPAHIRVTDAHFNYTT